MPSLPLPPFSFSFCGPRYLAKQGIQISFPEQAVPVQGMPVGRDLALAVPVPQGAPGHAQVVRRILDSEVRLEILDP